MIPLWATQISKILIDFQSVRIFLLLLFPHTPQKKITLSDRNRTVFCPSVWLLRKLRPLWYHCDIGPIQTYTFPPPSPHDENTRTDSTASIGMRQMVLYSLSNYFSPLSNGLKPLCSHLSFLRL